MNLFSASNYYVARDADNMQYRQRLCKNSNIDWNELDRYLDKSVKLQREISGYLSEYRGKFTVHHNAIIIGTASSVELPLKIPRNVTPNTRVCRFHTHPVTACSLHIPSVQDMQLCLRDALLLPDICGHLVITPGYVFGYSVNRAIQSTCARGGITMDRLDHYFSPLHTLHEKAGDYYIKNRKSPKFDKEQFHTHLADKWMQICKASGISAWYLFNEPDRA